MRILVALDDSKYADNNVEYIEDLAKKLNAEITLLTVVAFPAVGMEGTMAIGFSEFESRGKEFLETYKKKLESKGLKVSSKAKVDFGNPANIINEEAEEGKYDLVALGAKGKSRMRNLLMGSVADGVARYAPCSVLIIR